MTNSTTTFDVATKGVDETWTMVAAILVFFMQAGFSMLEAGTVRAKNTQGILLKNMLDACIGAICWWVVGYGLAFGEDKGTFIGGNLFFAQNQDFEQKADSFHYLMWFFQWAFCATAATIVSGALAERVKLPGYAIFMVVMTSFIYPVVVHWTWGGGWLSDGKVGFYKDFAGSGIVHMCGGVAALTGAAILGPREGRFDDKRNASGEFSPHSVPMVVLGTFILWFGWYGFNAGSTVSMTGENTNTAALVAVTTTLSAAAAGLVVFFLKFALTQKYDVCALSNGILAGLVSITAPCDGVHGWAAVIIGFVGGFVYLGASMLLQKLHIDDPLDAFAVHGACGAWGVIAVAFFNVSDGILYGGNDAGKLLGWQLCGIVVIGLWTAGLSGITFFLLRKAGLLRLSASEESGGADEHSPTKAYSIPTAAVDDDCRKKVSTTPTPEVLGKDVANDENDV